MLILFVENVGNFQNDARDSIVVLTRIAWAAIVTSASKVSYDHQQRRGISWLTLLYSNLTLYEPPGDSGIYEKDIAPIISFRFDVVISVQR